MCPSSGLWGGLGLWFPVYHLESTIVRRAPGLTLYERGFLFPSPHTCTLCLIFSLYSSVVGLANPCTCWRKDTITWLSRCASHACATWSAKSFFLSFLYINLLELGVEVAFNNRSAVTHHKDNLLEFPLWSSCSVHTNRCHPISVFRYSSSSNSFCLWRSTGWPRPIGCLILQVSFCKLPSN